MIAFEDMMSKTSIKEERGMFHGTLEGEELISAINKMEVEDFLEDYVHAELTKDNKYRCELCNTYFHEDDVQHRIEDSRFTAPLGATFIMGGNVGSRAVCPLTSCREDLEVCS